MFVRQGAKPVLLDSGSLTSDGLAQQALRLAQKTPKASTSAGHSSSGKKKAKRAASGRRESVGKRPTEEDDVEAGAEPGTRSAPSMGSASGGDEEDLVDLDD